MDNFPEINLNMKGYTWKLWADIKMGFFFIMLLKCAGVSPLWQQSELLPPHGGPLESASLCSLPSSESPSCPSLFCLICKDSMGWVPHTPPLTPGGPMFCTLVSLDVGSLLLSAWNPATCLSRSISVIVGKCSLEISPHLHFTFMFYSSSQVFQFFPLEYSLQQRPCCSL